MSYTVQGTIIHVGEITEHGASGFTKREFVIETDGDYPQKVKFELVKDKTAAVDESDNGSRATVHFDLRGREYNGNYYTNLNAWKVEI